MGSRTLHLQLVRRGQSGPTRTLSGGPGSAVPPNFVPRWAAAAAWTTVLAALPTSLWRVLVGFGVDLGTPATWRAEQDLPGTGTAYVCLLSVLQLLAAVLALRLVRSGGDRVPGWSPIRAGRQLPTIVVCLFAVSGAVALAALCVLSITNWSAVSPFTSEPSSGWSWLCTGCYLALLLWPPALLVSVIGYAIGRRHQSRAEDARERPTRSGDPDTIAPGVRPAPAPPR